jgi:hypothetical protein
MKENVKKYFEDLQKRGGYIAWISRKAGQYHIRDFIRIVSVELQDDRKNDYVNIYMEQQGPGNSSYKVSYGTRRIFYDRLGKPYIKAWGNKYYAYNWSHYRLDGYFDWTRNANERLVK